MHIRIPSAAGAVLIGVSTVIIATAAAAPAAVEVGVFARMAAAVVSFWTGAPVLAAETGWAVPIPHAGVVVTRACSGTDFFILLAGLMAWHAARDSRCRVFGWWWVPVAAMAIAVPVTVVINAMRIVVVAQAHRWVIPHLPDAYAGFAHLLAGVAIFLPALVGLNFLLESHARSRSLLAR